MIQNKTKYKKSRTRNNNKRSDWYFLFQYLVAPKGAILLVVLKTSVVPVAIYQDSPPLFEGEHLVEAL